MSKFINDKYKKVRGGYSRLLQISCEKCDSIICTYQKDGPGILKRIYLDRMSDFNTKSKDKLECKKCKHILGILINFKKENRPAYRLFVGAVTKQIIKS